MKFGHVLLEEEALAPAELRGHFIQYKRFKKLIKRRLAEVGRQSPAETSPDAVAAEKDFLRQLRDQIKVVDRKFSTAAAAVLAHYDGLGRKGIRDSLKALLSPSPPPPKLSPEALLKLQKRVHWTKKYAELNATALRKIAKKRDKLLGGGVGQCFMQACFKGQVSIHAILSMPLMRELTAVELLLASQLQRATAPPAAQPRFAIAASAVELQPLQQRASQPAAVAAAAAAEAPAEPAAAAAAAVEGEEEEPGPNYTCPICLDLLLKPVALECGHIFCARCAISTALGHDRAVGDAERLLTTLAAYSAAYSERPCPSCRAASHGREGMSVFWEPRAMPHLELLLRERFPGEYRRRQQEDDAHQAQLRAARQRGCFPKCCCPR